MTSTLRSAVNKFLSRELGLRCKDEPFEEVILKINSSQTIDYTKTMLDILFNKDMPRHEVKRFLAAYMIIGNSKEIFNKYEKTEEELEKLSNQLIQHLEQIMKDVLQEEAILLSQLTQTLVEYEQKFNQRNEEDRKIWQQTMAYSRHEMQETKKALKKKVQDAGCEMNEKDELDCQIIDQSIAQIDEAAHKIFGEDISAITDFDPEKDLLMFEEEMQAVMEQAFWNKFTDELTQEDYTTLVVLLTEVQERLCGLTPNRPDIQKTTRDTIDVDFIKQKLEHDAFRDEDFVNLVLYILDRIRQLESPSENAKTDEIQADILSCLDGQTSYATILPMVFRHICHKLDKIEADIRAFIQDSSAVEMLGQIVDNMQNKN